MTPTALTAALEANYGDRVIVLPGRKNVIISGPTASRTLWLGIGDDTVRIHVGQIVHGEVCEEDGDIPD